MTWDEIRGVCALVVETVEQGALAVEKVHLKTTGRAFALIEAVPVLTVPTRLVHTIHDASVSATYAAVRQGDRLAGKLAHLIIDAAERNQP